MAVSRSRYHWLLVILPCYVVYAGIVYWYFHLYMAKWRFASLQDLRNIFRAVTVLAISLLVLDYVLLYPALFGTSFSARSRLRSIGCCRCSSSAARASPIGCSGIRARNSTSKSGRGADADRRARGGCRSSVARHRERRGHEMCCRSASCRRRRPTRARHPRAFRCSAGRTISKSSSPRWRAEASASAGWF